MRDQFEPISVFAHFMSDITKDSHQVVAQGSRCNKHLQTDLDVALMAPADPRLFARGQGKQTITTSCGKAG